MDLTQTREMFGVDDQSWLGSEHGTQATESVTLDVSAFDQATHYPDGFLPSGLPLGRISASGLMGPYNDGAADGTQTLEGFLWGALKVSTSGDRDVSGAMLTHGKVRTSRLPVSVDAAGQADVAGSIRFVS